MVRIFAGMLTKAEDSGGYFGSVFQVSFGVCIVLRVA